MSFFKNFINNSSVRRVVNVLKNRYFIATFIFLLWVLVIDNNNLIAWYKDLKEVAAQNRQKKYYQEAIRQADERLKELSSNKDSLERFAREQYLFHEEGEDVFVVE